MIIKKSEKEIMSDKNEQISKLSEQSLNFIKEIVLNEFYLPLPLSKDDFLALCDYILNTYELGLLDNEANGPRVGCEDLHKKAVNFITEHSNSIIDLEDLNSRLLKQQ